MCSLLFFLLFRVPPSLVHLCSVFVVPQFSTRPSFILIVSVLATVEPLSRECLPFSPISRARLQKGFSLHLPCYLDDHPIFAAASLATPLNLDPASSCSYYRLNDFDGVKVHGSAMFMCSCVLILYPPTCVRPYLGLERMVCFAESVSLSGITPTPPRSSFPDRR